MQFDQLVHVNSMKKGSIPVIMRDEPVALRYAHKGETSSTIFASILPSIPIVSSPTVTGSSNRCGPHDRGLKERTPFCWLSPRMRG